MVITSCVCQAPSFSSASGDRVTVTLIPGDGVGPEMMDSAQEVLQSMGARLDFEPIYFSEVRNQNDLLTSPQSLI